MNNGIGGSWKYKVDNSIDGTVLGPMVGGSSDGTFNGALVLGGNFDLKLGSVNYVGQ